MIEIVPAILPKSFFDLEARLEKLLGLTEYVQIDVCDGKFTPKASWPYNRELDEKFKEIILEKRGFPHWEGFNYEIDLMVADPAAVLEDWIKSGAERLVIHVETAPDFPKIIDMLSERVEIVAALSLDTPIETIESYASSLNGVQCMGISKIGFQGQSFDARAVEKVRRLREKYGDLTISVDGGVNLESGAALINAGANRLVVGSAIFESDDIASTIRAFKKLRP